MRGESAKPVRTMRDYAMFVLERFGAVIAVISLVLLIVVSLQVSSGSKIIILNADTAVELRSEQEYQQKTAELLRSSWMNNNKITVDTRRIERSLKLTYPELSEVSMVLPLIGQRPIVYLQLTEPKVMLVTSQGRSFIVDERGRALAPTGEVSYDISNALPTVTDESGFPVRKGDLALERSAVSFLDTIQKQFTAKSYPIGRLVLPRGTQELDVYLQDRPYHVKFNIHETNARQQAGAYFALRERLDEQGRIPSEYVDVRLSGRAYYK